MMSSWWGLGAGRGDGVADGPRFKACITSCYYLCACIVYLCEAIAQLLGFLIHMYMSEGQSLACKSIAQI